MHAYFMTIDLYRITSFSIYQLFMLQVFSSLYRTQSQLRWGFCTFIKAHISVQCKALLPVFLLPVPLSYFLSRASHWAFPFRYYRSKTEQQLPSWSVFGVWLSYLQEKLIVLSLVKYKGPVNQVPMADGPFCKVLL